MSADGSASHEEAEPAPSPPAGVTREGLIDGSSLGHTATVGSTGGRDETRSDRPGGPADGSAARPGPGPGTAAGPGAGPGRAGRRGSGRRRRRGDPNAVVPDAQFTSYYGRPVVRHSPWTYDIPLYLFLGGLAGASSLLAEGAQLTGRPALARSGRLTALTGIVGSFYFLVHDLGKPSRFINMLRVVKPTSPMSMGTWFLVVYGPAAGVAGAVEVLRLLPVAVSGLLPRPLRALADAVAHPAAAVAAAIAPAVATYTAVLLTDSASPAWFEARRELPFVFAGSAAAAAGGAALIGAPLAQSGPARRAAVLGAVAELAAQVPMKRSMGLAAEALESGAPGRWHRASELLTAAGAVTAAVSGRSRALSAAAGVALLGGSLTTRLAVFYAGQESAKDPRYTVVPQRERVDARAAAAAAAAGPAPTTPPAPAPAPANATATASAAPATA